MSDEPVKADAIDIREDRDGERPVVLRPDDNDLFVQTGRQVIRACRLSISIEVWLNELAAMLEEVRKWIDGRARRVRSCYCAARGEKVILFFSPASAQFDFDLADELAELNGRLGKEFNVGMVEVRQIPWGELDRFLDVETSKHVYGDKRESHPAVEA